MLKFL
jgi:glycine dehydrogenase